MICLISFRKNAVSSVVASSYAGAIDSLSLRLQSTLLWIAIVVLSCLLIGEGLWWGIVDC